MSIPWFCVFDNNISDISQFLCVDQVLSFIKQQGASVKAKRSELNYVFGRFDAGRI